MQGLGSLDSSELKERLAKVPGEIRVQMLAVLGKVGALAAVGDLLGAVDEELGEEHIEVGHWMQS